MKAKEFYQEIKDWTETSKYQNENKYFNYLCNLINWYVFIGDFGISMNHTNYRLQITNVKYNEPPVSVILNFNDELLKPFNNIEDASIYLLNKLTDDFLSNISFEFLDYEKYIRFFLLDMESQKRIRDTYTHKYHKLNQEFLLLNSDIDWD